MLNKLAEATGTAHYTGGRSPHGHAAVEGLPDQPGDPHDQLLHSYWARPESIHHDPSETMPERSMPAASAKSMVLDILELDMNPRLNLAGWLTTLMEPEGEEVIQKAWHINEIDSLEYPSASTAAQRCVNMLGALWNAPPGFVGTDTVGSTEACYLGALAMKKNWAKARRAAGLPADRPNLVMGANAQVAWQKACVYFDIECRTIKLHDTTYVMDPALVADAVDENTIGVAAMVGSTYTGEYEDVATVDEVLEGVRRDRGLDVPIHVDAAGGGLIAPLCQPDFIFDFRLSHVHSISFSAHKFGFVYPGIAFAVFRSADWVPEGMKFTVDYLGGTATHMTMNFSRNGAFALAAYYNFVRLGKDGYRRIFANLFKVYDFLTAKLEETGHFEVLSTGDLPVVAFALKGKRDYDEYDVMHKLRESRFMLPAYKMAADLGHVSLLRACIRQGFDMEMAESLVEALGKVIEWLDAHGAPPKKEGEGGMGSGGGGKHSVAEE